MGRSRRPHEHVLDLLAAHPSVDLVVAGVVVAAHRILGHLGLLDLNFSEVSPGQRTLVYATVATIAALAAGFNNTAVGSYVGSVGPVVDGLRRTQGRALRKGLRSVGSWLWLVALAALVCLLIDPADQKDPTTTRGAGTIFEVAVLILVLKFFRLSLIQDLVLKANDLSATQEKVRRTVRRKQSAPREAGR